MLYLLTPKERENWAQFKKLGFRLSYHAGRGYASHPKLIGTFELRNYWTASDFRNLENEIKQITKIQEGTQLTLPI